MAFKRVYHPTNDAFQDVPEGDVEKWAKAGWLKGRPSKHTVDESERPEVGSFVPVSVPSEPVFSAGGDLPSGVSTVTNDTGRAEPVTKAAKADGK